MAWSESNLWTVFDACSQHSPPFKAPLFCASCSSLQGVGCAIFLEGNVGQDLKTSLKEALSSQFCT
jgi:hypothetical protein